ncbi:MAG: ABC transporter permease [Sedimentisphaerales bacterium]|nr:ABC transporter permease [Sedimentisphaerales bacterium]
MNASRLGSPLGWFVVPVILLIVWQIAAVRLNQPWIFPPVTRVMDQLVHPFREHYASGSLLSNTFVSLLRVLLGFCLAAVTGIGLGIAMGSIRILRKSLEPMIEVLRPLCPIAWIPFAIAVFKRETLPQLFGFGYTRTVFDQVQLGMVFVIFVGGFFPVLTNTLDGVTGVRRNYLLLARALGAKRRQIFWHVYLPASMPMILTGLRQGLGLCWFVIIAAEMLPGAESGIGYLLIYASDNAAMDIVIAAMLIVGSIGAILSLMMRKIMSGLVRWHGKEL